MKAAIALLLVASLPLVADARPLRGGGLDKAATFELEIARAINRARAKKAAAPIMMDEQLRTFCRSEAELITSGEADAGAGSARLVKAGLAGEAYRIMYGHGKEAARLVAELLGKPELAAGLLGEFNRLGVGAILVDEKRAILQAVIAIARDQDPRARAPGLSQEQTDPVIREAEPKIRECYDRALTKNPNLGGDVLFQLIIGPRGEVTEAKLHKSLGEESFDTCALAVARGLVFPAPYKGNPMTLNQRLRFMPPQGERRVGLLTKEQIRAGFDIAASDFRKCYDDRAANAQKLAGKILLELTIAKDGSVRDVRAAEDSLGDAELMRCVLTRARALHFARPNYDAEVTLTYPLSFAPPAAARK